MASVMGICGGLVGPKSGNVEKVLVFKSIFEGRSVHGRSIDRYLVVCRGEDLGSFGVSDKEGLRGK